ncbi:MAG: hypothetical protein JRG74_06240 [Deltaproteobacteria bacterium]|nr:hypothetical protein [Deltaproteobacteria bacterium]
MMMMKKLFVILSAIMFAVVFAVPAGADVGEGAVDWNFYGSVRMQTFNVNQDENNPYNTSGFDDRDSRWGLNTVSRIGATVQNGDIGGRFEYGHTSSDVSLRRLYGTWKEYTPLHFVTNQVYDNDYGLRGFGGFFTFNPMIQVKVDGFKLAFVRPGVGDPENMLPGQDPPDPMARADYDTTYPKVEASYTWAMDTFSVKAFGGWSTFEVVNINDAMVWEGQNVGLYGLTTNQEVDFMPDYDAGTNDIRDNNGYGGVASIGVKINDVIGVEAGYGYVTGEDDPVGKNHNDEAWAAYLQAPITLAQGVTVVPEIGHYDYEENDANEDQGHESYFGAKWQINF